VFRGVKIEPKILNAILSMVASDIRDRLNAMLEALEFRDASLPPVCFFFLFLFVILLILNR